MAKYLNQSLVTDYVQLCAALKKMEQQKKDMRDELLEGFKDGLECPRRGPWLVTLTHQMRRSISWEDEFVKLAKETLGKGWVKRRAAIEKEAPVVDIPVLLPGNNPDYDVPEPQRVKGAA
jgi:hypothetical protein